MVADSHIQYVSLPQKNIPNDHASFDDYRFTCSRLLTTIYYTDALHLVANIQGSVSFSSNTLVMTDIIEEEKSSHEERTVYENGREELPCGS